MPRRQPRKPTTPFGVIVFSKSGKVSRRLELLSTNKDEQQSQVAQRFCEGLRKSYRLEAGDASPVAGTFPDAMISVDGKPIDLEITEIVQSRDFELPPIPLTPEQRALLGRYTPDPKPNVQLDEAKRRTSLWRAIDGKLKKNYPTGGARPLWLLVFSTSPAIETLYIQDGVLRVGEPLRIARLVLAVRGPGPFQQIWFTNLLTRPVRVWPPGMDGRQVAPEAPT